jgi:hypothetical protein
MPAADVWYLKELFKLVWPPTSLHLAADCGNDRKRRIRNGYE